MSKVLALKEEGTHPPAEGFLAGFADVRGIRSPSDLDVLVLFRPDIVICDISLPAKGLDASAIVRRLAAAGQTLTPLIMWVDFKQSPARMKGQLSRLSALRGLSRSRLGIPQMVQLMDVSQETLGRILNVSSRTANRWMKGARPRPKPELAQLENVVGLLRETFTSREAIRSYLHHPNPSLGDTPLALLVRGEFEPVVADLMALREGAYE